MFQVRRAQPTVVITPLPSKQEGKGKNCAAQQAADADPYLRPANEDDDGYDPYSDRREEPALFEASPWD